MSVAVEFRREANFFTIANPHLALRFSVNPPGSLVSLAGPAGVELLNPQLAQSHAALWRLEFPQAAGLPSLTSRDAQEFDHNFEQDAGGTGRLTLEWGRLKTGTAELALRVRVVLTLPVDSPVAHCRATLELPDGLSPAGLNFIFPDLSALSLLDPVTGLFLPLGDGLLIHDPKGNFGAPVEWLYPGDLTMQFAGVELPGRAITLYLAAHDPAGALKGLRAGPDDTGDFHLSLLHFPPPTTELAYDVMLGLLPGGWPEAAALYRTWAGQQPWQPSHRRRSFAAAYGDTSFVDEPAKRHGYWLVGQGEANELVTTAISLQRAANNPVMLLWQWWHNSPGATNYPDYFPPREGVELFTKTLARFKNAGISAWPALDPTAASVQSAAWEARNLKSAAALSLTGGLQEQFEDPFIEDKLIALCPAAPAWQNLLRYLCDQLTALGASGVWLTSAGATRRCFAADHAHPPGAGDYLTHPALAPCPAVATDPTELQLSKLEANISSAPSRERAGRLAGLRTDAWEPLPLLQAVYAPHLNSAGLVGPFSNTFPRDPLWPEPAAGPRLSELALLRRDYSYQFSLEAARNLLWGNQPALTEFSTDLIQDPTALKKFAFINTLLQVDAMEPVSARGRFLGPLPVACDSIDVEFLVNSTYTLPGQRRIFVRTIPSVMATAWRNDLGRTVILLVNLRERDADFALDLGDPRLALTDLRAITGLTFTPGLGGKPARLNFIDTRVSGRLAGHSAAVLRP